jgi:hypothetical protein
MVWRAPARRPPVPPHGKLPRHGAPVPKSLGGGPSGPRPCRSPAWCRMRHPVGKSRPPGSAGVSPAPARVAGGGHAARLAALPGRARRDGRASPRPATRHRSDMFDLAVHLLRFRAEVTSPLRLPPAAGAALRGALFGTLRAQFCAVGGGPTCGQPPAAAGCPVCYLLAPTQPGRHGGQDVPRPYVLRVPLDAPRAYASGQPFEFTLATFGGALGVFPYALLGVQEMGQRGLGVGRAGSFRLTEVWAENPLAGRQERIFRAADGTVATPALPIDAAQITAEAGALAARLATPAPSLSAQRPPAIRLALRTPTRLVESGRLVKPTHFELATLLARLLERLDALGALYGAPGSGRARASSRAAARLARPIPRLQPTRPATAPGRTRRRGGPGRRPRPSPPVAPVGHARPRGQGRRDGQRPAGDRRRRGRRAAACRHKLTRRTLKLAYGLMGGDTTQDDPSWIPKHACALP